MSTRSKLLRAARFLFTRQLKPVIGCVFPLAKAARAHRRLAEAAQFGKIVLEAQ
jgi:NADPH:quinone reductase-like Zn-dependent oxidoreductase